MAAGPSTARDPRPRAYPPPRVSPGDSPLTLRIPEGLARLARGLGPEGAAWLEALPRIVDECAARWSLRLGSVVETGYSLVIPATRGDGTAAMLKVGYPEPENLREAEGLRRWAGGGAVRLLDADAERNALLLERAEPGTPLWDLPEEDALVVAVALLPRLWIAVERDHPFERLPELAAWWAASMRERWERAGAPFERALVDEAAAIFGELGAAPTSAVLLHRDFHGGNVLAARREPWLAIDPKPTVGEREYDAAWYLGDRRDSLTAAIARRRLDAFADVGLDRERLRRWTVARYALGALWSYESGGDGSRSIGVARLYEAPR